MSRWTNTAPSKDDALHLIASCVADALVETEDIRRFLFYGERFIIKFSRIDP